MVCSTRWLMLPPESWRPDTSRVTLVGCPVPWVVTATLRSVFGRMTRGATIV